MNRADIQGLLFSGYSAQPASALLRIQFASGFPNAWLRRTLPQISSGATSERSDPCRVNLAFTFVGLEKLGLPPASLAEFSDEFRQGMAHPERAAVLGDLGPNHPSTWEFSDRDARAVDGALFVYAPSAQELGTKLEEEQQALARFGLECEVLHTYLPPDGREHFGFRMSVSQPFVRGIERGRARRPRLATGEFLLGYEDGVGDRTLRPGVPPRRTTREPLKGFGRDRRASFGFNGSYLVLRKLEQRVDAFRAFLGHAERHSVSRELCAAKLVGRWPNGASLALHPEREPGSSESEARFGYRELDPLGYGCPLGAHVRRANPRDALSGDARESERHRLLRRGRLYGPERDAEGEASERGLLFLALNADLGRQFEYVQSRLAVAQGSLSLRGETDAFLGTSGAGEKGLRHFTLPAEPVRKRLFGLPDLVRARGGLYGFLPSLRALGYLADLAEARALP